MATCKGAGQLVRLFSTSAVKNKLAAVPLKLYGVEGRYATALYSAATKQKKLDTVEKEMTSFMALVQKDIMFKEFLSDPSYQRQTKRAAINKILKDQKYSEITCNFFDVVAENGRLPKTAGVVAAFNKLMSAHRGEVICSVTTAKPLAAADEKELRAALQGFAQKGQALKLELKVDETLLGGMVVYIADKYIDMSTATKLKKYTNVLSESVL